VDDVVAEEASETTASQKLISATLQNRRWLGFELSVLRRLKFSSIAIPFAGRPDLGWHLKCWGKQVFSNDICQWSWWMSRALIENSNESLDVDDVAFILANMAHSKASTSASHIRTPVMMMLPGSSEYGIIFDN
jgi:hypothetical protein